MAWWVWLVCLLAGWARAETVAIASVDDWNAFVERSCGAEQQSWNVTLQGNLDFTGLPFTPIGTNASSGCTPFRGSFDGTGHSITGVSGIAAGSNVGLFCCLQDATVSNLVVERSCSFAGTSAGVLAPIATGSLHVCNVTSRAHVSGTTYVGGFVGVAEGLNEASIVFENVTNDGVMDGTALCIGGFLGKVASSTGITVGIAHSTVSCVFNVTVRSHAGGFLALAFRNSHITLSFTESASVMEITFSGPSWATLGGFVGSIAENNNTSILVSGCKRAGDINATATDTNSKTCLAGIIAKVESGHNTSLVITNTTSTGQIGFLALGGFSYVGGIIGFVSELTNLTVGFKNVISLGLIAPTQRDENNYNYIGGFVASFHHNTDMLLMFDKCKNERSIESHLPHGAFIYFSGFVACFSGISSGTVNMNYLSNYGNISVTNNATTYAGGFVGQIDSQSMMISIYHTTNYGLINATIKVSNEIGGFVGSFKTTERSKMFFDNCSNSGSIIVESSRQEGKLGGFVGLLEGTLQNPLEVELENCVNSGNLQGSNVSGFFNQDSKENVVSSISNSINSGTVSGIYSYGIATNVTNGENVVLLNRVTGSNHSEPFWDDAYGDSLFCESSFCSPSDAVVLFHKSTNDVYCATNDSTRRVDDLLNWKAKVMGCGMMWTSQLSLVDESFNVTVSGIINLRWLIKKRRYSCRDPSSSCVFE